MVLLVHNTITDERKSYLISRLEDFEPIFEAWPSTKPLVMTSYSVADAAERVARYLNSHHMDSWVDKSDLSKSIRDHALALGLSFASILGGLAPSAVAVAPDHKHQIRAFHDQFGHKPEDAFLWNIMKLESSGGKNTRHPPVQLARYKNQKALGKWGLLTSTVRDILIRRRAEGASQKGFMEMEEMGTEDMSNYINENPQIELELARWLAKYVIKRQKGDARRAAYSWLHGHNLAPNEITEDDLAASDYVLKYRQADKVNPMKQSKSKNLHKKEKDAEFKARLKSWKQVRFDQKRSKSPPESNYVPDPGRIREKELDERPRGEITGDVRDKLLDAVEAAKKGVKKV